MDHKTRFDALARRDFLKITGLGALGLAFPGEASSTTTRRARTLPFYVGTYTSGKKSEGIYFYELDLLSGELRHRATTSGVVDPSFLTLAPNRRYLYAVNEVEEFGGKKSGAVSAFAIDRQTGGLSLLNQQPSLGGSPCYVTVDRTGRFVLVANYSGGNVAVLPIHKDGSLREATDMKQNSGKSINAERQDGPHAHCVELDPANRFAYVCDLGTDKIMIFRFDARRGKLTPAKTPWVELKPGAGPRHLTFHPSGRYVYGINELHATVTVFARNAATGMLKELETVATLPKDYTDSNNTSADIHLTPNGRFLYSSNRGHDSIAAFSVNPLNGKLSFIVHQSTEGKAPRNFAIDPTGRFLLAANQRSDNIVVFKLDPRTGRLQPTGQVVEVPSPVCLKFTTPAS